MAGMAMAAKPVTAACQRRRDRRLVIKNFAFSPATVTVNAGSTVVWTNDDSIQHDITFNGGGIASSVLNHNDTFSHTFPTAGTYHYICSIHPFMHGTVIVTGSGSQHANATQPPRFLDVPLLRRADSARSARRRASRSRRLFRVFAIVTAALVATGGYVHFCLYRHGYRTIPKIGVGFLLQVVTSAIVVVALLVGPHRVARLAGWRTSPTDGPPS